LVFWPSWMVRSHGPAACKPWRPQLHGAPRGACGGDRRLRRWRRHSVSPASLEFSRSGLRKSRATVPNGGGLAMLFCGRSGRAAAGRQFVNRRPKPWPAPSGWRRCRLIPVFSALGPPGPAPGDGMARWSSGRPSGDALEAAAVSLPRAGRLTWVRENRGLKFETFTSLRSAAALVTRGWCASKCCRASLQRPERRALCVSFAVYHRRLQHQHLPRWPGPADCGAGPQRWKSIPAGQSSMGPGPNTHLRCRLRAAAADLKPVWTAPQPILPISTPMLRADGAQRRQSPTAS